MYPHGRLLVAALTFSGTLGVSIALVGYAAALWLASLPPSDPPDNAPIRAVGLVIYVLAPAVAVISLAIAIPVTYFLWKRQRPNFAIVALMCAAIATSGTAYLLLPDSSISSTLVIAAVFSALMIGAAWAWRLALPRSNPSIQSGRAQARAADF